MRYNRRLAGVAAAVMLPILALLVTFGLLASPARAQTATTPPTYAITQPSTGVATTTIAPTTTTAKHGALAFTGADIAVTVVVAAAALGAGGLLVLATRRRKASAQ